MSRPDLGSGYGGWQAVDATPQVCEEYQQVLYIAQLVVWDLTTHIDPVVHIQLCNSFVPSQCTPTTIDTSHCTKYYLTHVDVHAFCLVSIHAEQNIVIGKYTQTSTTNFNYISYTISNEHNVIRDVQKGNTTTKQSHTTQLPRKSFFKRKIGCLR